MAFSVRDVAFEGFRLARERPAAIVAWSLLQTVVNLGGYFIMVGMAGPQYQSMQHMDPASPPSQAFAVEVLSHLMPAMGLVLLLSLLIIPVVTAAVYRTVLRPQDRGVVSLKLGGAEVRQLVVAASVWFVLSAVALVGIMATMFLAALFSVGGPALQALAFTLGAAATTVAAVWVLLRLSFAGPLTFDAGKVSLVPAWRLTKGRTATLLGAYLLAMLMAVLVGGCFDVIFAAGAAVVSGKVDLFGDAAVDFTSLDTFFTPMRTANLVFSGLVSGLTTAIVTGANARAYAQLKATPLVV